MNLNEFRLSISSTEYKNAVKAWKFKPKLKTPKIHWRIKEYERKIILKRKVEKFFDTYKMGKCKKKSIYPTEFKKKQSEMKRQIKSCQKCRSKVYLQVHHIDKNKFNNENNNLTLLCFNCHKSIHQHLKLPTFLKI